MEILKKTNKRQIVYFICVIIWMIIVFIFSSQEGETSGKTSSQVTIRVVEVIYANQKTENEKEQMVETIDPIIRKIAHYSIYALGGILIINYINTYDLNESKKMLLSICLGSVYAITDEIHQYFVPGRSAMITDVLIDSLGALTGICIYFCVSKIMYKSTGLKKIKLSKKYSLN